MTAPSDHTKRAAEAKAALDAINRDSHGVIDSALARAGDRLPPEDPNDPAEIWGRRIGRGLAVVVAIGLVIYLAVTYLK